VPEAASHDEIGGLLRAFNRMTNQLATQRTDLMEAYGQIDERRRFTETVLSGVSAGVIGLDAQGRIELPNRAASELLGTDLWLVTGQELASVVPEFARLMREVREMPEGPRVTGKVAELQLGPPSHRRTLLVRIGAENADGAAAGYVVTFDDITALQAAQRQAAWADVARRIAHEIKNPLTPIQLSAERLKRRFLKEITSDPDTFALCADTIVRHVGDIGRMVDEFSRFARMPQPQIRNEDVGRIAREVLALRRTARPELDWQTDIPEKGPIAPCDGRLLREALTNLLQNAEDAIAMVEGARQVSLRVTGDATAVRVIVMDDGIGLPQQDREKLTEPYVTHKPKGTGLGLAIVKKIMEDHGGDITLDDRTDGRGAIVVLTLKLFPPQGKLLDGA
jgi:two-component system nitrogen regulation sensor histidine kinase NtrY